MRYEFVGDNSQAQSEGDTAANFAKRIRRREQCVLRAWRTISFETGRAPTIHEVSDAASALAEEPLGHHYCTQICERNGYAL